MTEQPTTEQPYTAEDVARAARIVWRETLSDSDDASAASVASMNAARAILDELAAARRLLPSPSHRQWIFPIEAKVDAILPDGTHRYWSTHCRHNRHEACSAASQRGEPVSDGRFPTRAVDIQRRPAACKSCLAPCICWCHATGSQRTPPVPINEESTEVCCDLHGRNCEQGGEECCVRCTEAQHFAPGHGGVPCSNPDLSANGNGDDRG